ncbi:CSC1-like protein hyp1 [Orobanche gracilis]
MLSILKGSLCHDFHDELEVHSNPYHKEIPRILFISPLGITYFFLAPLILPFLLIYYALGYIIYRNQLLNVMHRSSKLVDSFGLWFTMQQ